MSKTSPRKKNAPTSEQVATIRRLADGGDVQAARQRLAGLRKTFPDFKPLLGLACELEDRYGEPLRATARAYEWQRALPNSRAAIEALCASARAAGLTAVYSRALQRLGALECQDDAPLVPEVIESALGALSLAQAEAIDLSRMHLIDGNPAAAVAVLQGVDHPSARNNLALALFITGHLTQARAVMETNWQTDPDNLFALESLVRWRCWADGLDRCRGFAATLLHTQPRRREDAIARVAALRFLGDDKAALLAWKDASKAPFWKTSSTDQREVFDALKDLSAALPGGAAMWFPDPWIRALAAFSEKPKQNPGPQWEQRVGAALKNCDAHVDYLSAAVVLGDEMVRFLALSVLKQRAKQADQAALASLQALLKQASGPDSKRLELLSWLVEQGLQNRLDPVELWLKGDLKTIRAHSLRLTDEPRPNPYSQAGTALNTRMHEALGQGKLRQALDLAQQLHQQYPNQPMALVNLAAIKEALRHPDDEVTNLYRRAYALAPDYLFARCGLAARFANEGHMEEAKKLLEGLNEREEFHRSDYRALLLAQRALALAHGDKQTVRDLDMTLDELAKNFAD